VSPTSFLAKGATQHVRSESKRLGHADIKYQLLKARALAAQQEREKEIQYEIEAKAARLKAQRKEEEEVYPFIIANVETKLTW